MRVLLLLALFYSPSAHAALCTGNTTFSQVAPSADLSAMRAVVTGGDGGLGFPISLELASRGATVIIASRNLTKATAAARRISTLIKGSVVIGMALDLGSLHSIRALAAKLGPAPLDLLINNAGIAGNSQHRSADGFELVFAVNYLGPFLLTHLLLPSLRKARGRVVNVASSEQAIACQAYGLALDCLHDLSLLPPPVVPNRNVTIVYHDGMPNEERNIEVYGLTKSLSIRHIQELARREPSITTYAVTPGWVNTSIIKVVDLNSTVGRRKCAEQSACPCPFSPEQGVAVIGVCLLENPGPSGSYISRPDECTPGEAVVAHGWVDGLGAALYAKSLSWANVTV